MRHKLHASLTAALGTLAVAVAVVASGCGDSPPSMHSSRGDLRVDLVGEPEPVRQGSYDFGEVPVGSSKRIELTLENVGTDLAHITATRFEESPAGTFFAQAPTEVDAGGKASLFVTFAPTARGPVTGRMVIDHSGDTVNVSLNLSGVGR